MSEARATDVGLFFALVAVLTVPFWLAAGATGVMPMPGLPEPAAGRGLPCHLSWQLFPLRGSWFDPRLHGLLTAGLVLAPYLAWQPKAPTI
jgi:hypothetical protein